MVPPASGTPSLSTWRVFPFNPAAPDGEPYSVRSVAPAHRQTSGRFDLGTTSVMYLGETPGHALAEVWRQFTGWVVHPDLLRSSRHSLALVEVGIPTDIADGVIDLTEPENLLRLGIRPDTLALPASGRPQTQAVSRALHDAGYHGFRWWSAIHGAWHTTVLFTDHAPLSSLDFGSPEILTLAHPAVAEAAAALSMRVS